AHAQGHTDCAQRLAGHKGTGPLPSRVLSPVVRHGSNAQAGRQAAGAVGGSGTGRLRGGNGRHGPYPAGPVRGHLCGRGGDNVAARPAEPGSRGRCLFGLCRGTIAPGEIMIATSSTPMVPSGAPLDAVAEEQFLASLRRGDEQAYAVLVRQYGGRMLAVARRFLRREEDSADAVQDALVSAFRSLDSFAGNSQLWTWLHRVVVNACLMKLRSRSRHPTVSLNDLLPTFDETGHHARPVA